MVRTVEVEDENGNENRDNQKKAMDKFERVMKNIKKEKEFCVVLVSPKDSVVLSYASPNVLMNFIKACAVAITASVESMADGAKKIVEKGMEKQAKQKKSKKTA